MKRDIGDYIEDIIAAITNATEFTKDMSYNEFVKDTKTVYAVIRAIEIIGEAVKNIPEEIKRKYPDIPWRSMAGMRDKVIHAYFGVKIERVWEFVKRDMPQLKPKFEKILEGIKWVNPVKYQTDIDSNFRKNYRDNEAYSRHLSADYRRL